LRILFLLNGERFGGLGAVRQVGLLRLCQNGTGKIINDETEVGGWPAYASGEPPVDTVRDGIPDEWKKAHGLKLNDPNVAVAVNADGYTMLEVYLNSLVR
jgi:hypothetical protein